MPPSKFLQLAYTAPLLILLMGADVATTIYALDSGIASEGNPVGAAVYQVGAWLMVVAKIVASVLVVLVCYLLRDYKPARYYFVAANAAMGGVVCHNFLTILPSIIGGG